MLRHPRRDSESGVTLLETLIVLVIIALVSGSLLQSASSVSIRQEVEASTALATRLTLLSDLALASGTNIKLRVDTNPWQIEETTSSGEQFPPVETVGWLGEMSSDNTLVTDAEKLPVSMVKFHSVPRPQFVIFVPRALRSQSPAVIFDGLTAKVMVGGQNE